MIGQGAEPPKWVTQYRLVCGACVSLPPRQASLHTDAFKQSVPFLEAPQALFRARRHKLHARILEKLRGSALGMGFRHPDPQHLDGRVTAAFGGGRLGVGRNPVPGGWIPAEGAPGLSSPGLCTPVHAYHAHHPRHASAVMLRHQDGMGNQKQTHKLPVARRLAESKQNQSNNWTPAKTESRRKTGSFPGKLAKQPAVRREIFAGAEPTTRQSEQPVCRSPAGPDRGCNQQPGCCWLSGVGQEIPKESSETSKQLTEMSKRKDLRS